MRADVYSREFEVGFLWFIGFLIGMVIPAFLASAIWSEKGGSAGLGAFMGFFLGWLGVLLAALITPTPQGAVVTVTQAPPPGEMKTCPRCAEDVKAAAVVCRYCGHEFESVPADPVDTFQGEPVIDIKEHSFGVLWGKAGGATVIKEPGGEWEAWDKEGSSLVPPNGYR